jgi:hypothetical protein
VSVIEAVLKPHAILNDKASLVHWRPERRPELAMTSEQNSAFQSGVDPGLEDAILIEVPSPEKVWT